MKRILAMTFVVGSFVSIQAAAPAPAAGGDYAGGSDPRFVTPPRSSAQTRKHVREEAGLAKLSPTHRHQRLRRDVAVAVGGAGGDVTEDMGACMRLATIAIKFGFTDSTEPVDKKEFIEAINMLVAAESDIDLSEASEQRNQLLDCVGEACYQADRFVDSEGLTLRVTAMYNRMASKVGPVAMCAAKARFAVRHPEVVDLD